jgi:hypothetical protein
MQEQLIEILSRATGWMTAAEIAAEGKWRSASNVSVALKQLEKSGAVTHRSRMTGGAKEVQWRHADKDFDDACEVGAKDKRKPKVAANQAGPAKAPEISADELRAEIQRQKGIAQEFIDKAASLERKFSEAVEEVTRLDRELAAAKAKAMPEKKSSKPRKPFSVTGLSGFHAGGDRVTLFLDRRLHAKSITLPADKLHQLAEMARAA